MIRRSLNILLILLAAIPAFAQIERLRDVKAIYVASLGDSDSAKVAREKLINRLASHLVIADSEAEADAILKGAFTFDSTAPIPNASLVLRLQTKDKRVLWSKELDQQHINGSALRDGILSDGVKALFKAIERDKK